jgi:hypothetical protein
MRPAVRRMTSNSVAQGLSVYDPCTAHLSVDRHASSTTSKHLLDRGPSLVP